MANRLNMAITGKMIKANSYITNKLRKTRSRKGMELVQVGILIAIAVGIGIIFKDNISEFVSNTFSTLLGTSFN